MAQSRSSGGGNTSLPREGLAADHLLNKDELHQRGPAKILQFFLGFFPLFLGFFSRFLGFDGFDWYLQRFAAKLSDLHGVVVVVVGWMDGWLVGWLVS